MPKFLSAPKREAFLKEFKLCIFCLGHKFNHKDPCKTKEKLKCEVCGGQHLAVTHTPETTAGNLAVTEEFDWAEVAENSY